MGNDSREYARRNACTYQGFARGPSHAAAAAPGASDIRPTRSFEYDARRPYDTGASDFEIEASTGTAWRNRIGLWDASMDVTVITTGGTIAKTYDESSGVLHNDRPVVESILARLRLPDLTVSYDHVLMKDSLDLTDTDRERILDAVRRAVNVADAVVVAHGTDTLAITGELLHKALGDVCVPVVVTGAMRPFEFRDSDAAQNVTEALLACRLVAPGVYAVMHNRVLAFPGVVKDHVGKSFVRDTSCPTTHT